MYQLVELDLNQVEIDHRNVRTFYDEGRIQDLRQSLKNALEQGIEYLHPPVVYPIGRDRYRVKVGNCRLMAAQGVVDRLHFFVSPAPVNECQRVQDQLTENLLQGGLGPLDTASALQYLKDIDGLSVGQLVAALKDRGISRSKFWVRQHLALLNLHPQVQEALRQGTIGVSIAWALRELPANQQAPMLQRVLNENLTLTELQHLLGIDGQVPEFEAFVHQPTTGEQVSHEPAGVELELQQRLAQAAERPPRRRPAGRRLGEGDGQAASRWELVAAPVDGSGPAAGKVEAIAETEWARHASDLEKALATEVLLLGGLQPSDAIKLACNAASEAAVASPRIIGTLNYLTQLSHSSDSLHPGSALAQLLRIRIRCMLDKLSSAGIASPSESSPTLALSS